MFQTLIDRIGHEVKVTNLELVNQAVLSNSLCFGLPNPSGISNVLHHQCEGCQPKASV
jgi:hypothetical protein